MRSGVRTETVHRDGFETFLRKFGQDSLYYDQACHIAGAEVELGDGSLKPIEEIETSDRVRTHTGEIRRVIKPTTRTYSGEKNNASHPDWGAANTHLLREDVATRTVATTERASRARKRKTRGSLATSSVSGVNVRHATTRAVYRLLCGPGASISIMKST